MKSSHCSAKKGPPQIQATPHSGKVFFSGSRLSSCITILHYFAVQDRVSDEALHVCQGS